MSTLQFGQSRTLLTSRTRLRRSTRCITFASSVEPCSASLKTFTSNAGTPARLPDTTRRQLLGAALVSGVSLLQGSCAALAPPPAAAKVTIANTIKGGEGERDVEVAASGIRMSVLSRGRGEVPASGSLVLVDVVGSLGDGTVFLDTRAEGSAPLAFQLGTTNKYVTEGLTQVVETMRGGDVKLAVVPPSLGYGTAGMTFRSGRRVPPNADLYYEISLLRCQSFPVGLACCSDADYPCIKNPEEDINFTS